MQYGYLTIDTYPTGAQIYIDGILVLNEDKEPGLTPAKLTVTTGLHNIKLVLEGYCDEFDAQYVEKDENIPIFHDFYIC